MICSDATGESARNDLRVGQMEAGVAVIDESGGAEQKGTGSSSRGWASTGASTRRNMVGVATERFEGPADLDAVIPDKRL